MRAILFIIIVGAFILNATNRSGNLFQDDDNLNTDTLNTSNYLSGSIDHYNMFSDNFHSSSSSVDDSFSSFKSFDSFSDSSF